jgi:hypothetical protein
VQAEGRCHQELLPQRGGVGGGRRRQALCLGGVQQAAAARFRLLARALRRHVQLMAAAQETGVRAELDQSQKAARGSRRRLNAGGMND